jgi:hypothetical protein
MSCLYPIFCSFYTNIRARLRYWQAKMHRVPGVAWQVNRQPQPGWGILLLRHLEVYSWYRAGCVSRRRGLSCSDSWVEAPQATQMGRQRKSESRNQACSQGGPIFHFSRTLGSTREAGTKRGWKCEQNQISPSQSSEGNPG